MSEDSDSPFLNRWSIFQSASNVPPEKQLRAYNSAIGQFHVDAQDTDYANRRWNRSLSKFDRRRPEAEGCDIHEQYVPLCNQCVLPSEKGDGTGRNRCRHCNRGYPIALAKKIVDGESCG